MVKLLKLREYLDDRMEQFKDWQGKIEDFYNKVTDKFRDWLGDGKQLADNVQEKGKDMVNKLIDTLNGGLGKFIKIDHLDKREANIVGVGGRWVTNVTRRDVLSRQALDVAMPLVTSAATGIANIKRSAASDNVSGHMEVSNEVTTTMTASGFIPVPSKPPKTSSGGALANSETNGAPGFRGSIPVPLVLLASLLHCFGTLDSEA